VRAMSADETYHGLPNYDSGWGEYDWAAVFEGKYNDTPPEWRSTGDPTDVLGATVDQLTPEDIAEIEAVWTQCEVDYADSSIVALMRTKDGRYVTLEAWSDSSGWGCQDATYWKIAPTRDEAIRLGLDNEGRARLGLSLPPEDRS
jgi:hypothetical protein